MKRRNAHGHLGRLGRVGVAGLVGAALSLQAAGVVQAAANSWTSEDPGSHPTSINTVAYGQDGSGHSLWVAGEGAGAIDTSPDGVHWTNNPLVFGYTFTSDFTSVVYTTKWVMVGQNGTIVTSPDGTHWTQQNSGSTGYFYSLAYGGGTYVAVGPNGLVDTSPDGTTWTLQASPPGNPAFEQVAYGNGQFVATADGGLIYTSPNGVTWTEQTSPTANSLYAIRYGGGEFVAVGAGGTIVTSQDGNNWALQSSGTSADLYNLAYGSGKWVAVGQDAVNGPALISSTDGGVHWNSESIPSESSSAGLYSIGYGNSEFVAGGFKSNPGSLILTEAYSTNDNLAGLSLSSGSLSPGFSSGQLTYSATEAYTTASIDVTPTAASGSETITVNGTTATSGNPVSVSLNYGNNSIPVVVTALSGATKTYTINVTRQRPSSNANLSNLTVSQGTLSPGFSSGQTTYSVDVPYGTSSITVTPTVADSTATVSVGGNPVTSGSASAPISLAVGANTVRVVVTAQNGDTKTYTVSISRPAAAPIGLSHSNLTPTGWTEQWSTVPGATGYNVYVNNTLINNTPITDTHLVITGLQPSTDYNVQVVALVGNLVSEKSSVDPLTTPSSGPTGQLPEVPYAGALPLLGFGATIGFLFYRNRRRKSE